MQNSFDPIIYLNIRGLKDKEKKELSDHLLNKISQYLLIRAIDKVDISLIKKAKAPNEIFEIAKKNIPDFENQVRIYLEDFKKEFNSSLKI
jgi:hypothetical protein